MSPRSGRDRLAHRLNQILPKITAKDFLHSQGIGNEIACYIFDYAPQFELDVRRHLQVILQHLASQHSDLKVLHFNLFDVILAYLESRGLMEKTRQLANTKGSSAVLKALRGPVSAEKICQYIARSHQPELQNLILISGVGSAWPLLRAHNLLNGLHAVIGQTPLVLFYPGKFDGTSLRLFGEIASANKPGTKNYYRAFTLIPEGETDDH